MLDVCGFSAPTLQGNLTRQLQASLLARCRIALRRTSRPLLKEMHAAPIQAASTASRFPGGTRLTEYLAVVTPTQVNHWHLLK